MFENSDIWYLLLVPLIIFIMPALDIPTGKTYKQAFKEMAKFNFKTDKDK